MDEFARVASLLWFVVIGVMFVTAIARAAAKECQGVCGQFLRDRQCVLRVGLPSRPGLI